MGYPAFVSPGTPFDIAAPRRARLRTPGPEHLRHGAPAGCGGRQGRAPDRTIPAGHRGIARGPSGSCGVRRSGCRHISVVCTIAGRDETTNSKACRGARFGPIRPPLRLVTRRIGGGERRCGDDPVGTRLPVVVGTPQEACESWAAEGRRETAGVFANIGEYGGGAVVPGVRGVAGHTGVAPQHSTPAGTRRRRFVRSSRPRWQRFAVLCGNRPIT